MTQTQLATRHPVVLRFAEMHPHDLPKMRMHGDRAGGDLDHVDGSRSPLNERLIGEADWVEQALAEIDTIKIENLAEELAALKNAQRMKDMAARLLEGAKDPWRASARGPLREVILTANQEWFEGTADGSGFLRRQREEIFVQASVDWLKLNFGADVIHARVDRDETACHIHAVIMPRTQATSKRRGLQRSLQPSIHPLIKDYEAAQDSVGDWFAQIGLRRGERGAAARRDALEAGRVPEPMREHVSPAQWRAQQALKAQEAAADLAVRAEQAKAAEAVLAARAVEIAAREAAAKAEADEVEKARAKVQADKVKIAAMAAVLEGYAIGVVDPETGAPDVSAAATPAGQKILHAMAQAPAAAEFIAKRLRAAFARVSTAATASARTEAEAAARGRWAAAIADAERAKLMCEQAAKAIADAITAAPGPVLQRLRMFAEKQQLAALQALFHARKDADGTDPKRQEGLGKNERDQ